MPYRTRDYYTLNKKNKKKEYNSCLVCSKKYITKKYTNYYCKNCSILFVEYKCTRCYQVVYRPRVFGKGDFCSWECRTGKKGGRGKIDKYDIYEFYNYTCFICDKWIDCSLKCPDPMSITLDHVIPRSQGGRSDWTNLVPAHALCNHKKGGVLDPGLLKKLRERLGFD